MGKNNPFTQPYMRDYYTVTIPLYAADYDMSQAAQIRIISGTAAFFAHKFTQWRAWCVENGLSLLDIDYDHGGYVDDDVWRADHTHGIVKFEREVDAIYFKLRWF